MVYCKLIHIDDDSVLYSCGAIASDLSGTLLIDRKTLEPTIVKQAKQFVVSMLWVTKLMVKYRKSFADGVFPEKIAYEC